MPAINLRISIRTLFRSKTFSLLNLLGLSLGFTACLLIGLFIWDEFQFDQSSPEGERIYRLYNEDISSGGADGKLAVMSPMYATTLKSRIPSVEQAARIMMLPETEYLVEAGNHKLYERKGLFVDSTFFTIFPLNVKSGVLTTALYTPSSIVISEDMASRFFGNTDPVGQQLLLNKSPQIVRAVFRKDPKFHLQAEFYMSIASTGQTPEAMARWGWSQFYTYVKLRPNTSAKETEAQFRQLVKELAPIPEGTNEYGYRPRFQPVKEIHLYSADFKFDNAIRGNITYVYALGIIAVFILFIACFNFVNLSTARSLQRAREVGVRKTLGAGKRQLLFQFVQETVLLSTISMMVAIALALLLLPVLNSFTGKDISQTVFIEPVLLLVIAAGTVLVGVLAGLYPALVLSSYKPVKVLKANSSGDQQAGRTPWLRHSLVVLQFSLAILLIICCTVVFRQVDFMHNKDLGFEKDQIMFFPMRGDAMFANHAAFKEKLTQHPGISSVSIGYGFPGDAVAGDDIIVPGSTGNKRFSATQLMVDHDYVRTLGLEIVAGRDFSKAISTDNDHAFIVNEHALKELKLGTPQEAIGKELAWSVWDSSTPDSLKTGRIIGVVRDFNYKSLYDKIETTVLQLYPPAAWKVAVKMKAAGMKDAIAHVSKTWASFSPDYPIEYNFLDQNFEKLYLSEDKLRSLLWVFTSIAVFIGCLGLLGLAAYSAERRKKEVGVRKVLGASVHSLVLLLSKDFIKLVLIALLIASPVAGYFMHQWLEGFAYRINIGWWMFAIAALMAIGIAFLTVGFQALKSAITNPVKSLRGDG